MLRPAATATAHMQGDVIKAGDLKPLTDAGLLYLAARMAARVEPWCPVGAEQVWREAVEAVIEAGNGDGPSAAEARRLARALLDHGARGTYGDAPEHVADGRNQAASALACALEATQLPVRADRWKRVRDAGKHMASVYALQAHAGRLAIEVALTAPWAAVRADIEVLAQIGGRLTVGQLRGLAPLWPAPLWPSGEPAWARPPR